MSWFEWTFRSLLRSPAMWMIVPISISGWLLFCRRDERSAIEVFLIAWLVALAGITRWLINACQIGGQSAPFWPKEYFVSLRVGLASGLLLAIIFSLPIVFGLCCRETVKLSSGTRWMMLAVVISVIELALFSLLYLVKVPAHIFELL